jgi:Protein of unknown function (DUF3180)
VSEPRDRVLATRGRDLTAIGVVIAAVAWVALRRWYGDLPPLRWFVPLSLALLALAEGILARQMKARIDRRPGTEPVPPLVAAQVLALAKASAIVGAAMVGVWVGLLLYVLPRLDYLAAAGNDTRTGVVGLVASATLVAAALWLEYSCRTPEPPEEGRPKTPNGVSPS